MHMIYWLSLASAAFIGLAALVWKMSAIARENRVLKAEFSLGRLKKELNVFLFQIFIGGQSAKTLFVK